MKRTSLTLTATLMSTLLLVACGGGGDDPADPPPPPDSNQFTKKATWTFTLPAAEGSLCYDFDAAAEVEDCAGSAWDVKVTSGGRSATLWTNSGVSGSGKGGAFGGPFDRSWTTLATWKDATIDPVDGAMPDAVYFKDSSKSAFTGTNAIASAAFEYDLKDDHQLYPNYRVFLITTDSGSVDPVGTPAAPVYALQVIGYYGGAGGTASGHPTLRWVDRAAPGTVHEKEYDASNGKVYVNLATGEKVAADGDWQIALDRYTISLNGGDSGSGKVAGFVGKIPAGFYDADGKPIVDRFVNARPADTLADLTAADIEVPAKASNWENDTNGSELNADPKGLPVGGPPVNPIEFGWYTYYPTVATAQTVGLGAAHMLKANPEGASLVRSGEGNSYARMHLTEIRYADLASNSSAQTWTIEFDVQPAK
ncbi:MAG: HmuY family protein [Burkholderiales bacterium]|nr:HmuY family protein [Burkholderiales bacterium]